MFDHIGSLLYIFTVPLRLHAAHVWRIQVFQGGGKFTMNKSLNSKPFRNFFYRTTKANFLAM